MNRDAYSTYITSNYRMEPTLAALAEAAITNDEIFSRFDEEGEEINNVHLLVGHDADIPPFAHPIYFPTDADHRLAGLVVVDVRSFVRVTPNGFKVSNFHDFTFQLRRARLAVLWHGEGRENLGNVHSLPATSYGRWISEGITHKLGLTVDDQVTINILATGCYLNSFADPEHFGEDAYQRKLMLQVARMTFVTPDMVERYKEILPTIVDAQSLIQAIRDNVDNPRVEMLNYGLLVSVLTYGWKGSHAKENMAVAIEHPPTWIAAVLTSITSRVVRDSPISRIVTSLTRRGQDKEFVSAYGRLLAK